MNTWKHLFLTGEFAPRAHTLEGLTLEQVGERPCGAPHSIFEELWHAATWQRIVLDRDEEAYERWEADELFPTNPAPEDEATWHTLVQSFLAYSERAVKLAQDEAWLEAEVTEDVTENEPGFTWRNNLESLAVHNAYHMGKIVLLRQLLGSWEPAPENGQSDG